MLINIIMLCAAVYGVHVPANDDNIILCVIGRDEGECARVRLTGELCIVYACTICMYIVNVFNNTEHGDFRLHPI